MNALTSPTIDETSDLLKTCFCEVFSTVFEIPAEPAATSDIRRQDQTLIAGSVGFAGDVNGLVYIYFDENYAKFLATRMLGLTDAEIGDELVTDVIGEISNMVVGSTKSRLCDSGADCRLTPPSIIRGQHLRAQPSGQSRSRLVTMNCDGQVILLELIMKSQPQP